MLDPYKNNCPQDGAQKSLTRGHYRRQYEAFATSGAWGHEWSRCGRMTLMKQEGATITVVPALCGCWTCELCGVRRVAWLKEQIGLAVPRYALRWFWTLPIDTKSCTGPESFALVTRAWHALCKALQKVYGRFSFVWTVEATKRGYAHLHVLTTLRVSAHELHDRWHTASSGSYMVKALPVNDKRVANYLAKYCVQQATLRRQPGWESLKGRRLFSKSRDVQFEPFTPEGDGSWQVVDRPYWDLAARLRQEGHVLAERTKGVPSLRVAGGIALVR